MDVFAHALWAGATAQWLRRARPRLTGRTAAAMVGFAVLPDLVPLAPALAWSFAEAAPLQFLHAHIAATPTTEPPMPLLAEELAHHLHCIFHSVVVAAAFTALAAMRRPGLLLPMLGWWLHIALDIPTHSNDYYPVPLFYPFTDWGVDGVPWTSPAFMALNYGALATVYLLLWRHRRRRPADAASSSQDGASSRTGGPR